MATLDALPVIKVLGRSVPLLLLAKLLLILLMAKLLLILARALSATGAPLTTVHALLVLMVLLPVDLEVLLSLLATARLIRMEMLKLLLLCALHVTSAVPVMNKAHQQLELPLCLLLASAQRTPTEMVPRAHSALLTLRPLAGVLLPQ